MTNTLWFTASNVPETLAPCVGNWSAVPQTTGWIIALWFILGLLAHVRGVVLLLREVRFWFQRVNPPDDTE